MGHVTGELMAFRKGDGWNAAVARTDKAYPGYVLTRRILLTDGFLADVFEVRGEKVETLDWFLRAPAELSVSVPLEAASEKPISPPYS